MNTRTRAPRRRYAVIDIGTNSLKLMVASVQGGRIDGHYFSRIPTRLGAGLSRSGTLGKNAALRTAVAVARLAEDARAHGADEVLGVGTYALRAARNGRAVARLIGRHAGIPVRVITGSQEAAYMLAAVRARVRARRRCVMVVDIGGGSAQLIVARGARTILVRSVPLGAVVLTERHIAHDPVGSAEYTRLRAAVDRAVATLFRAVPTTPPSGIEMVVSGGAATTAAAMLGALRGKSGSRVSLRRIEALQSRCLGLTVAQRRALPGMQPDRADILPAGLAVLISFARHARVSSVRIVEGGWREGVILERARKAPRARARTRSTARARAAARKDR